MVTVCSGTSCLKATRKAPWSATDPWMTAHLEEKSGIGLTKIRRRQLTLSHLRE